MHYNRMRKNKTLTLKNYSLSFERMDELKFFMLEHRKINGSGCWEWTRSGDRHGYGKQHVSGKNLLVPRISKAIFDNFDITSSLCVLHKCDNPPCFNPEHLYVGTMKDNMMDKTIKGRGKCGIGERQGHAKLTDNKVKEIRKLRDEGMAFSQIQKIFSVSNATIRSAYSRHTWSHVK